VGEAPTDTFTRLAGVVHVHTTFSDGGGTPAELVAAARAAGLQFVVITDHNNLDAKPFEGFHDGVLFIVGTEVSTASGHILGLGIPDPAFRFSGDAGEALDDIRTLGGFAFAAHPLSPREEFRFTAWDLPGPWGLEILNGDSEWRESGWRRLLWTGVSYALNRRYALLQDMSPPRATLQRWDALLSKRDAPGLAGADAHGRVTLGKFSLPFPSYEAVFRLAQDHVLLDGPLPGDAGAAARVVLEALRKGRFYVGLDALAPAGDFFFEATGGGRRWTMGETAPVGVALEAGGRLPSGARVMLFRNGEAMARGTERVRLAAAGEGVYRVEVAPPGWDTPWVLSNAIAVFDSKTAEERASRLAWPPEPDPPQAREILDSFEGRTIFHREFDSASSMDAEELDPHGGVGGSGAARLAFRLGVPGPGHPHTWCALVNRENRDLSGRAGLLLSIRADGVYRLWVQLRDENALSADEGTEWWFMSVRTSPDWKRVALPFNRFRSLNKNTDGRLDLDKIRGLVFVVDGSAVKVGTKGTIWIDDVGVY
jgi:hypothetical protein